MTVRTEILGGPMGFTVKDSSAGVDMPVTGSTVVRRQLGRRLRRLREKAGKSVADIEASKLLSAAKLWRIENGKASVKISDVWALCRLYGADEQTTDALSALATGTTGQGWWEDYTDLMNAGFGLYVGLEAAATRFRTYEAEFVPGLFQTTDYIREVCQAETPDWGEDAVERLVTMRRERQQDVLGRTPASRITAVLNAAVLGRVVGGAQVMAGQIRRLRELAELDQVQIRVLPWEAGAHAAMSGAFVLLDFDNPDDPSVVYFDAHRSARYLEQPTQVDEYRRIFDLIYRQAVPLEEYPS